MPSATKMPEQPLTLKGPSRTKVRTLQDEAALGINVSDLRKVDDELGDLLVSQSHIIQDNHAVSTKERPMAGGLILQADTCLGEEGNHIGVRLDWVATRHTAECGWHGGGAIATSQIKMVLDVIIVDTELGS